MTIERNTQHSHSHEECNVLTLVVRILVSFPDGPDNNADKQEDIDNLTRIERHAKDVDEQQLEPAAYLYDARYDTIEYGSQDNH